MGKASRRKINGAAGSSNGLAASVARIRHTNPIRPGNLSPTRTVPESIPRPDYALTGTPQRSDPPLIKTPEEIERMRRACVAAREVLEVVGRAVAVGVTTDELDAICHQAYIDRGGYPSTLNYRGYKKSLCTSINEVICHGIPDDRPLEDGDIVNCDVTIFLDGMHGDTSAMFVAGNADEESLRLIRITRECLEAGIAAVRPGGMVRDIGQAIHRHAQANNLGVVRAFVGHGIGPVFHMSPSVPHYFDSSATELLQPGMTFTIEPMITLGDWHHKEWKDGWTAVTRDHSRTAQYEHTVLVTETGVEILTGPTVEWSELTSTDARVPEEPLTP